eukprot:TRINITY_DN1286_c0_g1_i1.p1 TRINITY_DN1286_c0_g1~~TRINITY_DN1286_c0_g1_i1.p1  ORF type:complete len:228 (+),score=56.43 TRINITY_DN1286_c0_g1_i1:64-747(+)
MCIRDRYQRRVHGNQSNMWILLALISFSLCAEKGVDVSTLFSEAKCKCLKEKDQSFFVPRCYQSGGKVDPNCVSNLKNGHDAGLSTGLYIFPCVPCGNPAKQVADTVKAVGNHEVDTYWVDVEKLNWHKDKSLNRKFIEEMVNALKEHGKKVGIYSSYYMWQDIVGLDYSGMSSYPLWYSHYDKKPSCSDFKPFGGWKKPHIKQFEGTTNLCQGGVDLNVKCQIKLY